MQSIVPAAERFEEVVEDTCCAQRSFRQSSRCTCSGSLGSTSSRGHVLQTLLIHAIRSLKPEGQRPAQLTPGWLHYLVLEEEYVNGRPNNRLAEEFHVSEATFHRARRQAIAHLTAELAAEEQRASQSGIRPAALRLQTEQAEPCMRPGFARVYRLVSLERAC
jgi:hypothetical protein